MGFGMFSGHHSPIAIDFGSSSVKMLQTGSGERPALVAAAEITIPDESRLDHDQYFAYVEEWIGGPFSQADFKGRRAVLAVPASQAFIQHMQINEADTINGLTQDDLIKTQLQAQVGCPPHGVVVRPIDVCTVHRNGQALKEVICFAIARDNVMRYVNLLKKWKIEVVGVHTDTMAMIAAFDHIHRRTEDANLTTLYIDMGWGGTRLAITHGTQIVFARHIPIGGRHFDQFVVGVSHLDVPAARAYRLSMKSAKPVLKARDDASPARAGTGPLAPAYASEPPAVGVAERRVGAMPSELQYAVTPVDQSHVKSGIDFTELLDTITDEMTMSLRYHQGLFPQRPLNRAVFVGGESRQAWLCQHIVKALRVPAQLGDPIARLDSTNTPPTPGVHLTPPQPGWAVACGLCALPTDL